MSKAEERALERFPVHDGASEQWVQAHLNCDPCRSYIEGYNQAVKDLELTWEDIKAIDKLLNQCVDYSNPYKEVLKRFINLKKCIF